MAKQVAILTNFRNVDLSYSLIGVCNTHIQMLVEAGHKPVVIVEEGFKPEAAFALPEVIIEFAPTFTSSNEGILPTNWKSEVDILAACYNSIFDKHGIQVVMSHDLVAQPAYLVMNMAARKVAADHPTVTWLSMVHSCFSSNVQSNVLEASKIGREPFPNGFILFPNTYDKARVIRSFNVTEDKFLHLPHATDLPDLLDMHPEIRRLCAEKGVLDKKVVMVMPARLDTGKNLDKNIELAAALKRNGTSVCLIFGDFASTGGSKLTYRDSLKSLAIDRGLDDTDVIWLSEFSKTFSYSAPRQVMRDLFAISNIFLCASKSETYSLVTQEAALMGNALILNFDNAIFRAVFGPMAKFAKFSSNMDLLDDTAETGETNTRYNPNIQAYFNDLARWCQFMITTNPVLAQKTRARTERSLSAVYQNFLAPMLEAGS